MADASCSGSTPFKQLVDQQGRDVSHHQDRLVGRPGAQAPGSFRSTPQPGQAQLGFDQFMNGPNFPALQNNHAVDRVAAHAAALGNINPPGFGPQFQQPVHPIRGPQGPTPSANWAAEFNQFTHQRPVAQDNAVRQVAAQRGPLQMMPPPQLMPTLGTQGTQVAQMETNMAAGFGFQANPNLPNGGFAPLYGPTNSGFLDPGAAMLQRGESEAEFLSQMDDWMAVNGPYAEARVDAVLEEFAQEIEREEAIAAAAAKEQADVEAASTHHSITGNLANLSLDPQETQDTEVTPKAKQKEELIDEDATPLAKGKQKSDIAEAASDLLKSVEHEQSDKWKKSKFIELMNDLAKGRKDVVDNDVRLVDDTSDDLSVKPTGTDGGESSAN